MGCLANRSPIVKRKEKNVRLPKHLLVANLLEQKSLHFAIKRQLNLIH